MPKQPLIVGNPVLVVVDIQEGGAMTADEAGIPVMPGHAERVEVAQRLLAAARAADLPVVFFQEVHRPSGVDFGRELDGTEGVHCVEGQPGTDLEPSLRPILDGSRPEFHLVKRRYSGFIGTEFDIVLRGLKADTLILIGGLTDVCVHYTFADAHQRDYYVRVVSDCVGGSSQKRHDASLDAMEYLQTGAVRSSAEFLDAFANLTVLEGAAS
ncbi:cysteine hydrolase [Mycobacterium sp. MS1601]|uniref:cysteine hydrolase family protein n=1 Tax=Mycobacterium sp. MS1601 TaxID=1936029 RepID=UPI00097974E7|nr:cysteine hydrolase [Mycobacterium sp. MS1601]AQA06729.1 cysteine hydrolase [Mycobacterium sp. MS1601]